MEEAKGVKAFPRMHGLSHIRRSPRWTFSQSSDFERRFAPPGPGQRLGKEGELPVLDLILDEKHMDMMMFKSPSMVFIEPRWLLGPFLRDLEVFLGFSALRYNLEGETIDAMPLAIS